MNLKLDEIDKVIFKISENTILETNHQLRVGESINFYDDNNQIIKLKKENNVLQIQIKINNIKASLRKKAKEQEE